MLAFGGGQAALPLVERLAVGETGWLTLAQFAADVGLSYAAAVGLLGVTMVALARPVLAINPALAFGAVIVLAAERLGAHPLILIAGAVVLGGIAPLLGWLP
jgi:chromate transport protein ChrA